MAGDETKKNAAQDTALNTPELPPMDSEAIKDLVRGAETKMPAKGKAKAKHTPFQLLKKFLFLNIGAIITAIGLEVFLIPNNIIDGGVVGLSIMAHAITDYPLGIFLVLINIPFVYLGMKQIGKVFALTAIVAILLLSLWSAYFIDFHAVTDDLFLAAIFGGIVTGLGVGIVMRNGGCFDGTEIVAIILDKRSVFSVGEVVMFINLFILSSAGLLFGWDRAMYSLFAYYVIAKTIDVVVKGMDESYAVMVVTSAADEINMALNEGLGRGVTILYGAGGYTGEEKKILYSVVTRLEIDKLKEIVLDIDDSAFVTINAVNDIVGGRFKKRSGH